MTATNAVGAGQASASSNAVTPTAPPAYQGPLASYAPHLRLLLINSAVAFAVALPIMTEVHD